MTPFVEASTSPLAIATTIGVCIGLFRKTVLGSKSATKLDAVVAYPAPAPEVVDPPARAAAAEAEASAPEPTKTPPPKKRTYSGSFRRRPGPPSPESFELHAPGAPSVFLPLRCEALVGRAEPSSYPSRHEVTKYAQSIKAWLGTLPWFSEETLESAAKLFELVVERGAVDTYFSMRLVALTALFLAAKYHELVESIKLREIVGLTEGIAAADVRKVEAALLENINFDVLFAEKMPAEADDSGDASPSGVEAIGLLEERFSNGLK